jgi:Do/DeqQ family serine protease
VIVMDKQRTRLGLAFAAVALGGIVLGFAVSARLDFGGRVALPNQGEPGRRSSNAQSAGLAPTPLADPDAKPGPPSPTAPPPIAPLPAAPLAPAQGPQAGSFSTLVKQVGPAVVHINVRKRMAQGLGTGFIINSDGTVLTNEHVVGGADDIVVKMTDGRQLPAKLVGLDPKTDLAVIKIESPEPLPAVSLGDSDALEVGDWVIAIGSPLGLDHTVTAGIVSAKERRDINPGGRVSQYEDFIQTDASINPGNSGGPLINVRGEVIGINSAVSMQGQGIGFAIPINMAKTLLPQLQQSGRVERSWLGVSIGPVNDQIAKAYGLGTTSGAFVADVVPGGPADKAGLSRGEVILTFDGKDVSKSNELPWIASTAGVGKTVQVVVAGPSGKRGVAVTLERLP